MHLGPLLVEWYCADFDPETGKELRRSDLIRNLVVDDGREVIQQFLANLASPSAVYLMVGASSTAADYTDERLFYEYNNNATRKSALDINGNPIDVADITLDPVVVSGVTYRTLMTYKFDFPATDGIDGLVVREAGLNFHQATPGSPSTKLGVTFNRLVLDTPETKTNGIPKSFFMRVRF